MNERLFELDEMIDLKKLEKVINDEIKDDIINDEDDVNTEKWGMYPVIYLENEEVRAKIVDFIKYVDEANISKLKKISYILTVIYLIEKLRFDILNIDMNNVYLLVSYLENKNIDDLINRLNIVNDEELLYRIRCFSLDLNAREMLLDYVLKNDVTKDDFMKLITENNHYQVLEIIK